MKFKYLGTAAAEGIPALFCNCDTCNTARRLGGKNIRSRAQVMINDDLLVDFGPDTFLHLQSNNIRGDMIKYLLITHSHMDHFVPADLSYRGLAFAHKPLEKQLTIIGSGEICKKYNDFATSHMYPEIAASILATKVNPNESYRYSDYEIIPLRSRHMEHETSLVYIIKYKGKTILYGNDMGTFYESVIDYLKTLNIKFDFISLDCTEAFNTMPDTAYHMGFNNVETTCDKLKEIGLVDDQTTIYLTHFSHNGKSLHKQLEDYASKKGWHIAYDGLEITI